MTKHNPTNISNIKKEQRVNADNSYVSFSDHDSLTLIRGRDHNTDPANRIYIHYSVVAEYPSPLDAVKDIINRINKNHLQLIGYKPYDKAESKKMEVLYRNIK